MECGQCGACLAVQRGARAVQCAHCRGVTRVGGMHDAVGFVKGVIANIAGGGTRPQPQPPKLSAAGYPRVHGKKRALLVGIKYTTSKTLGELSGPINDVKFMRFLLCEKFGFPSDCVLVLTDEERDPNRRPTKYNIMLAMRWLVHGCSSGDSLVFHFSGHGGQVDDQDDDEQDGSDETICPLDSDVNGDIRDDEINEAIVRPLVHSVRLHAIIDACHSGTVLDLPHLCRIKRNGKPQWEDHSPPTGAWKNTSGGHAILISGCTDSQESNDDFGVASMGALTYGFFVAAWSEKRTLTYGSLLMEIKATIRGGGGGTLPAPIAALVRKVVNFSGVQEPQLSSSEVFDINRKKFVL